MSEQLPEKKTNLPAVPEAAGNSQGTGNNGDNGSGADPRDRVTPDAFFVAPELLGKPLAQPMARGWAWVVDGVVVGMLSQASTMLLALALALLSFQLLSKSRRNGMDNTGASQTATDNAGASNAGTNNAGAAKTGTGKTGNAMLVASQRKWVAVLVAVFVGWTAMTVLNQLFDDDDSAKESADEVIVPAPAVDPTLSETERELQALREENERLKAKRSIFSVIDFTEKLLDDIGFGFGWGAVYFSLLPAWWQGQTLGKRLFGLRVVRLNGKPLTVWNCFDRYGGYAAGFATGLLGFAQVFWDANRQAIHDKISFTVVLDERHVR